MFVCWCVLIGGWSMEDRAVHAAPSLGRGPLPGEATTDGGQTPYSPHQVQSPQQVGPFLCRNSLGIVWTCLIFLSVQFLVMNGKYFVYSSLANCCRDQWLKLIFVHPFLQEHSSSQPLPQWPKGYVFFPREITQNPAELAWGSHVAPVPQSPWEGGASCLHRPQPSAGTTHRTSTCVISTR